MSLNTMEAKWMILYPKYYRYNNEDMLYPLYYNNNILDKCTKIKYLGLFIDYKKHYQLLDIQLTKAKQTFFAL